jgi:hypothetical protein
MVPISLKHLLDFDDVFGLASLCYLSSFLSLHPIVSCIKCLVVGNFSKYVPPVNSLVGLRLGMVTEKSEKQEFYGSRAASLFAVLHYLCLLLLAS